MSQWCRLWDDMVTDPKFRVIAKRSGRPTSEVIAVFVHMMTNVTKSHRTQTNASERGCLEGWDDESVAIAIDAETQHVADIREAMQGRTLEGSRLTGWDKRQPIREDNSAERAKAWREKKRDRSVDGEPDGDETERDRTQTERDQTLDKIRVDTDKKEGEPKGSPCPKPSKSVRTRIDYPSDFEDWWKAYPTDQNMSKAEALKAWRQLGPEDRQKAIAAAPRFRIWCRQQKDYRTIHAERWLSKRRFDGFAPQADEPERTLPLEWAQTA